MMDERQRAILHALLLACLVPLPRASRLRLERWLRGREEVRKLHRADAVIVSFGNSGRTWLRVLLSRVFERHYGLSRFVVIDFANLNRCNNAIPKILFTHDNYLKDFLGNSDPVPLYGSQRTILLVRDPADVAVSQYFQWRHRMRRAKKYLNNYPIYDNVSLFDFMTRPSCGLPKIIHFMNRWADALPRLETVLLVRYEDLRLDTEVWLRRILEFVGTPCSGSEIEDAVTFASIENMRRLEARGLALLRRGRLFAGRNRSPDSFKARRGEVGGYRAALTSEQIELIDRTIDLQLAPIYGYQRSHSTAAAAAV